MNKIIEFNDLCNFWYEDGILHSEFLQPVILDVELGKKMIEKRHSLSNTKPQFWCYDFTNVKEMPKDARDYANKHGQDFLYASAAVVKSSIEAFIVNFFIKLKNPKIPFKAFTSKDDAIAWLKELKRHNEQL